MSNIKDVAALASVSVSTVSIILNGKSRERKISQETQDRVYNAIKELNYQPNLSAKKLRSLDSKKTIALFWTTDFRGVMLARFLSGLQNRIKTAGFQFDIIIYPYENDRLCEEDSLTKIANFHGAIIANASQKDIEFLKTLKPMTPIVLYNRELEGYSSVSVDDKIIGQKVFEAVKHKKNVGLIKAPYAFEGMKKRDQTLTELLQSNNQNILEYKADFNDSSYGYKLAESIDFKKLDILFVASDMLAAGIIHYCYQKNIKIPDDIEIIAIGNGLTNIDEYLNPSLSVIEIPMETMAEKCIDIMNQLFHHSVIINKTVEPQIQLRNSTKNKQS